MFIVGGSNAYPAEIERILQSHPAIKQAIVVGVPHRRLGEVAMAFVQLHEGKQAQEDDIRSFCKENMADFKVPRLISIVEDFPRTSTGKIQRFVIKKQGEEMSQKTSQL
jgi:fatty-acyl-CoA synthase